MWRIWIGLGMLVIAACDRMNEAMPLDTQSDALRQLEDASESPPKIRFEGGIPRYVTVGVPVPDALPQDAVLRALDFLDRFKDLYGLEEPRAELYLNRIIYDDELGPHVFFGQHSEGIPLFAAELAVHLSPDQDMVRETYGRYVPKIPRQIDPIVPAPWAEQLALSAANGQAAEVRGETRLMLFNPGLVTGEDSGTRLVWRVMILAGSDSSTLTMYFVDALNGAVLYAQEQSESHADMKDVRIFDHDYKSYNCDTGPLWFTTAGPTPSFPATPQYDWARTAWTDTRRIYDYFERMFHHHAWDGRDQRPVRVVLRASNTERAFSVGRYDSACDRVLLGQGTTLDVYTHEWTHAVNKWSGGLGTANQTGALNESYADVFGALVDGQNWEINEGAQVGWRDLGDPPKHSTVDPKGCAPNVYRHPDHMDDYWSLASLRYRCVALPANNGYVVKKLPCGKLSELIFPAGGFIPGNNVPGVALLKLCEAPLDLGGVHINTGIPNKAAYLVSQGGSHRGINVTGIGPDKTAKLYYKVLTTLTVSAEFRQARDRTVSVARDFTKTVQPNFWPTFSTTDVCSVINAFAAVGLGAEDSDCDGIEDTPDQDGDGILDWFDNCPAIHNRSQSNHDIDRQGDACDTDDDNDNVFDKRDNCPVTANAGQRDIDNDGIGAVCDDNDSDGVYNDRDNCINLVNPLQLDSDGDRLGDRCDGDDDNDSIVDQSDNCPAIANTRQLDGDADGVGDACDNCRAVRNADQSDVDCDGRGDVCDDDQDNDGLLNDADPFRLNPQRLAAVPFPLSCNESADRLKPMLRRDVEFFLKWRDADEIVRVPISPCAGDEALDCPAWLPPNFQTEISVSASEAIGARIVDDRGFIIVSDRTGVNTALRFNPRADSLYHAPLDTPAESETDGLFIGTRYFLELYPLAAASISEEYRIEVRPESGEVDQSLH